MRIYLVFNLYVISDNYNVNLQHEVTTRKIVYTSDVYCLLLCVCVQCTNIEMLRVTCKRWKSYEQCVTMAIINI